VETTQLWHPDTCRNGQCIIEVNKADWTVASVVQTCAHHAGRGHATEQALFEAVLERNRIKNYATYEAALEAALDHALVPWRLDDEDRIVITLGLNAQRRARLQAAVDARVGAGKVIIE
jgi:hypothetical protein